MWRWVGRVALWLMILLLVVSTGGWLWLRSSLPRTEGEISLLGIKQAVEIKRDRYGIPHIRAKTERDAYFALGFVHAQDRLWQMDFQRRLGAGRLSEVIGPPTLPTDRYMRTLGLHRLAKISAARLSPKTRAAVDAYTAGVNAYLESRNGAWPIEFYLLRYRPEPWTPADSLVWGKIMGIFLSRDWREEALRARIKEKLGGRDLTTLFPDYPGDGPRTLASIWPGIQNPLAVASASNAWVLSGNRTVSGKPLLANDPHLRFRTPGIWYLARIETPELSLTGATVPGVPFMLLGHNQKIAWGITSAESDVQDLFIEKLEPSDPTWYRTPEGARPFITQTETIRVRGQGDVTLRIRRTRHGPVLSDMSPELKALAPAGNVIALATPALREDDRGSEALYKLNHARNWPQFQDALRDWHSPHVNFTYADTEGNIGFFAPARLPLRRAGDGRLPAPGSSGSHDWVGTIPYDDLPKAFNPRRGWIANANNPPSRASQTAGRPRTPGYRARRIASMITAKPRHDIASMTNMQRDNLSLAARDLLPLLLRTRPKTERAARAHALLRGWDGTMARSIPQPLIFTAWLKALNRRLFADELGTLFAVYHGLRPLSTKSALTRDKYWCDDRTTALPESCDDQVSLALQDA